MRIVAVSNNAVRLSFLMALLRDAGIAGVILDHNASIAEGSSSAIPQRLAVATEDEPRAKRVLTEAGEA